MAKRAVTFSTDGNRDYVTLSDGVRYTLGPVSVLTLVSKLVAKPRVRRVLDEFNRNKEVMAVLDTDELFRLLAPKLRSRLGSALICEQDRKAKGTRAMTPTEVLKKVAEIENQVTLLQKSASAENLKGLESLVGELSGTHTASYDTLTLNNDLVESIVARVEVTAERVNKLASGGKKAFNSTQALLDLHAISNRVAGILENADLSQSWVTKDLNDLAAKADHLHGLFASVR